MRTYLLAITIMLSVGCAVSSEGQQTDDLTNQLIEHWRPPLVAVLADPERFVGTRLHLTGYLHQVPGHAPIPALFLSRDHALHADYGSSVLIGPAESEVAQLCGGQYVQVEGVLERLPGVTLRGLLYMIPTPARISALRAGGEKKQCWPNIKMVF